MGTIPILKPTSRIEAPVSTEIVNQADDGLHAPAMMASQEFNESDQGGAADSATFNFIAHQFPDKPSRHGVSIKTTMLRCAVWER
jgi:hypothetical protein